MIVSYTGQCVNISVSCQQRHSYTAESNSKINDAKVTTTTTPFCPVQDREKYVLGIKMTAKIQAENVVEQSVRLGVQCIILTFD